MQKKILSGIFLCMLLLMPMTVSAMENKTSNNSISNNPVNDGYTTLSADPPVWAKGTVWNYDLTDINIDIDQGYGLVFHLYIGTANIPFEVVSDSGSSYQVSFKTKISGNVYVEADYGGLSVKLQGNLVRTKLKGEITYRKSDLGISSISMQLSGKVALSISKPIRLPAIRAFVTLNLDIGFSNPYTLLSFPMETNMTWGLPATGISIDGSLKSPWLRVVNIAHGTARFMGLIPDEYKEYSDLIAQMLPVIDFSDTLTLFEIPNPVDIPELPVVFYCSGTENITVQAGSFNAYNISLMGVANMYYAPDVGRVIKISGNIEDFIPYLKNINMELVKIGKSTELGYN
jgi:hypothetical protein